MWCLFATNVGFTFLNSFIYTTEKGTVLPQMQNIGVVKGVAYLDFLLQIYIYIYGNTEQDHIAYRCSGIKEKNIT